MVDDTQPAVGSATAVCPWCSASLTGTPETCPSCGATIEGDAVDPSLPGLTAIDAAAIVRNKQAPARSRNRLLSWISGDYTGDDAVPQGDLAALAPPDLEVRREMLRLELEAEVANLQAEAEALRAEATVEGRADDATPEDQAAAEQVVAEIDAVEAELSSVDAALETAPLTGEEPAATDAAAPDAEPAPEADAPEATAEPEPEPGSEADRPA
jgi:hypothetical protein